MYEKTKGGLIAFLIGLIVLIIVSLIPGNEPILWAFRIVTGIITFSGLYIAVQGYFEQRKQEELEFLNIANKRFGEGEFGAIKGGPERRELLRRHTYAFPKSSASSTY
jgi:hypothetical protein